MIKRIESITADLRKCNGKCRKCRWRDGFSGECTLNHNAAEYIEALETDNAKQMVYCKDCIYCEKADAIYRFSDDEYQCKNRDGLPVVPKIKPMDYCSRGKTKESMEVE